LRCNLASINSFQSENAKQEKAGAWFASKQVTVLPLTRPFPPARKIGEIGEIGGFGEGSFVGEGAKSGKRIAL
jgi:hypothetical protein